MHSRERLVLCGALGLALGLGFVLLGGGPDVELPPAGPDPILAQPPQPESPTAAPAAAEITAVRPAGREPTDTTGWTKGIVRGDVKIAVSILDKIQSISVVVEELRNPVGPDGAVRHVNRLIVPVKMEVGTPTFEVRDIPFSDHPYTVRLYSPGLNGTGRTVTIDEKTPLHEDLELCITPGAPFTVLLRDQDRNPYAGIDVRLLPAGDPPGRPTLQGTSNNFGSVVFESVLAGDYQVVTAQGNQPFETPQLVYVTAPPLGNMVQGQSCVLTVQRGVPLEVSVVCGGYGVAEAKVHFTASDRSKLTQFDVTTDFGGRVTVQRLLPGTWLVEAVVDGYERSMRQITVAEGQPPPPLEFRLVRIR